ncbi:hypothetical protein KC19_6G128800 [Ceratodon purpureus]|uniref:Uncharacterized protein n=1 Tax=Ceratodon purpureus TaxID=3225 RepID=A0A8T0HGZ1_CERPU|nr:hypothetical protein KC19_6G128800 [Ceratodon purpureus]
MDKAIKVQAAAISEVVYCRFPLSFHLLALSWSMSKEASFELYGGAEFGASDLECAHSRIFDQLQGRLVRLVRCLILIRKKFLDT